MVTELRPRSRRAWKKSGGRQCGWQLAKAVAEVAAQLSGEEREEVNDLVERWNTQGLPEEEKKK